MPGLSGLSALLGIPFGGALGALMALPTVYGEIYSVDGALAQNNVGTTPVLLTGFDTNNALVRNTTPDHTNDRITVDVDVTAAIIMVSVSYSGTANADFECYLRVNGVEQHGEWHRRLGAGGDIGAAALFELRSLSAGDILTLWVESDDPGGGDNVTVGCAQLVVIGWD